MAKRKSSASEYVTAEEFWNDWNVAGNLPPGLQCTDYSTTVEETNIKPHNTNGGTKHDQEKNLLQYIPPHAEWEVGHAFTYGANKYGAFNYSGGIDSLRLIGGARRHINQWMRGETKDAESNVHHLASAVANLMMLLEQELVGYGTDTRQHKPKK